MPNKLRYLVVVLFLQSFIASSELLLAEERLLIESDAQKPCVDMIRGWYAVDARRLDSILHSTFVKQGLMVHPETNKQAIYTRNKTEFIQDVGADRPSLPENEWAIKATTLDITDSIATVRVESVHLIDVCQLGKVDGEWKIFNVIWTLNDGFSF